jgi:hypothetical protein
MPGLGALAGRTPIEVRFVGAPRVHRGRLNMHSARGTEVHGASFVKRRLMVLDEELIAKPKELSRIAVHELFHFVWPRLGNPRRRSFEELLARESERGARGELGWSAASVKDALSSGDRRRRSRRWREYVCESFCDTAAWLYGGPADHDEYTLGRRWRRERRRWFEERLAGAP